MRFKIIFAIELLLLCVAGGFGITISIQDALAEDGNPVFVQKPSGCVTVNLNGGEDYFASAQSQSECVYGSTGINEIWTFGGADWISGGDSTDPEHGGDGQDQMYGGKEGDNMDGEAGNDYLWAGCPGGCDQTGGNNYINLLKGGDGNDQLAACNNVPNDRLQGGQGGYDTGYGDPGDTFSGIEEKHLC